MLIAYSDILAAAVLAASAADLNSPVSNIQLADNIRIWRCPAASGYFTADFGSPLPYRVLVLSGVNLTAAATIRLEASDVSTSGNEIHDSGTVNAGIVYPFTTVYLLLPAQVTSRYIRVTLADATLTEINVGRGWISTSSETQYGPGFELQILPYDQGRQALTVGGAIQTNPGPKGRGLDLLLNMQDDEALNLAARIDLLNGQNKDILLMIDTSGSYIPQKSVLGLIEQATGIRLNNAGRGVNLWSKRYIVRERL